jgi:predicted anti-sigma-YlaC factor YlaD
MSQEHVAELAPWYVNGSLDEERRARVEEHLSSCAECRALVHAARDLQPPGANDMEGLLDHPPAQHLDRFAFDPESLNVDLSRRIREHLAGCPACAGAVSALSQPQADAPSATRPSWWNSLLAEVFFNRTAAVAYLFLLVLLVPAYFIRQQVTPPSGAFDLTVLSSATRGTSSSPSIVVEEGQTVVVLGAEFEVPGGRTPVSFALMREETVVWSIELGLDRVERNLETSGIVTLVIPIDALRLGSHRLLVEQAGGESALLDTRFTVEGRL